MEEMLTVWIERYLEALEVSGHSPYTRKTYASALRHWAHWVGGQPELATLADLTLPVLVRYQQWLLVRPHLPRRSHPRPKRSSSLCTVSRNHQLTALRGFFRFLKRSQVLLVDPSAELSYARTPKTLPRSLLSVSQVYRLLAELPGDTPRGRRDRAAVELLYATGMRRGELLGLRLESVDLRQELVQVQGKGNKERLVPMGSEAARTLRLWLEARGPWPGAQACPALFLSPRGGPLKGPDLQKAITEAARRAGIRQRVSFHTFRHSCASHLLAGRADIRYIQALLGHELLTTTQRYTQVQLKDLRQMLLRCHPREQMEP